MLISFLSNWGLFAAKTLTLTLAILAIIGFIFATAARQRRSEEVLEITSLNERQTEFANTLADALCSKTDLKTYKKNQKKLKKQQTETLPHLFVLHFEGDVHASQVSTLREEISALLSYAKVGDGVLLILESAGGMVHPYGLAAAQLERLKAAGLSLTVAVDTVAASGGYLMACVADHIIASPFAVLGSIGVVGQLPNFHRFLNKHDIDFEQHTAGQYKRTLTMLGENTPQGREKFKEELEEVHQLFKQFITQHRPQLDLAQVATGEHWYGKDALALKLIDTIDTSDNWIQNHFKTHQVVSIEYSIAKPLSERIGHFLKANVASKLLPIFQARLQA